MYTMMTLFLIIGSSLCAGGPGDQGDQIEELGTLIAHAGECSVYSRGPRMMLHNEGTKEAKFVVHQRDDTELLPFVLKPGEVCSFLISGWGWHWVDEYDGILHVVYRGFHDEDGDLLPRDTYSDISLVGSEDVVPDYGALCLPVRDICLYIGMQMKSWAGAWRHFSWQGVAASSSGRDSLEGVRAEDARTKYKEKDE